MQGEIYGNKFVGVRWRGLGGEKGSERTGCAGVVGVDAVEVRCLGGGEELGDEAGADSSCAAGYEDCGFWGGHFVLYVLFDVRYDVKKIEK